MLTNSKINDIIRNLYLLCSDQELAILVNSYLKKTHLPQVVSGKDVHVWV